MDLNGNKFDLIGVAAGDPLLVSLEGHRVLQIHRKTIVTLSPPSPLVLLEAVMLTPALVDQTQQSLKGVTSIQLSLSDRDNAIRPTQLLSLSLLTHFLSSFPHLPFRL